MNWNLNKQDFSNMHFRLRQSELKKVYLDQTV